MARQRKPEETYCKFAIFKLAADSKTDINQNGVQIIKIICKEILWKYSIQSLKKADSVLLSLFMADATSLTPPIPRLSATLLSNKCLTLQYQRTRKCKYNNTISMYRETFYGRHTEYVEHMSLNHPFISDFSEYSRRSQRAKNKI